MSTLHAHIKIHKIKWPIRPKVQIVVAHQVTNWYKSQFILLIKIPKLKEFILT